ncbi:uncharacterized protein C6orf136 homolog [Amia ocellicauda]|uniref:uncharacterized protein C6orf136 homolog n=1 Tax=Amia ocellicauda TaxID=2972642 RepID=UPI0034649FE9
MAVCRRGVALRGWVVVAGAGGAPAVRCGRSQCCPRVEGNQLWSLTQRPDWWYSSHARPISSLPWAMSTPTCLRYQTANQLKLEPYPRGGEPIRPQTCREALARLDPNETVSLCLLLGGRECEGQRTLVEVPLCGLAGLGELLASGAVRPEELSLRQLVGTVTTVDGAREDDITVTAVPVEGKVGDSFRSLFWQESCPAPFMGGSRFYCFHSPEVQPFLLGFRDSSGRGNELRLQASAPTSPGGRRDREMEEKLALMYDRLRGELPNFFLKTHDYSIYSQDMEFINSFFHTKTRGRVLYQLSLALCRMVCVLYFTEVRMEVLKLTQHSEDLSVRARWRIRGLPLHLLLLRFYRRDKRELYRTYDAFSTFYLGADGLIHCHRVDKVMPAQPPLPRLKAVLAGALVALGLQEQRPPALNLLPLLLSQLVLRLGRGHC